MRSNLSRLIAVAVIIVVLAVSLVAANQTRPTSSVSVVQFESGDILNMGVRSNRHTMPEPLNMPAIQPIIGLDGYVLMAENDYLELWFREYVAGIRIRVKETGYVWGSIPYDGAHNLNRRWETKANAFASFEYFEGTRSHNSSVAHEDVQTTYTWLPDGFYCEVYLTGRGIRLTIRVTLDGNSILYEVPTLPTEDYEGFRFATVFFMPFLGTVEEDAIPGYMFVPDGPGALIRFRPATRYVANFSKRVFGNDYGVDPTFELNTLDSTRPDDYIVQEPQILMPVFGMVHGINEHAFLAVIENGEVHATIQANVAGTGLDYNWATARFDYRRMFFQPTNRGGRGIHALQPEMETLTPAIRYHFLSGDDANYAGMARLYRSILLEQGVLENATAEQGDIPLRLSLIGADFRSGFIRNSTTAFTTAEQAKDILTTFNDQGISNISLVYQGWQRGGLNGASHSQTSFLRNLGTTANFNALQEQAQQQGRFYLGASPNLMNNRQISPFRHSATNMSRARIVFERPNWGVIFQRHYLLRPSILTNNITRLQNAHPNMEFAMADVGRLLYSDHTRNAVVSRDRNRDMLVEALEPGAFSMPNQYLWHNTIAFFDVPMISSQFLFQTDTVPFLQMVLRGSMEYYAPYTNIGAFSRSSLLKMIEFGANPSFVLTASESITLSDTPLEDFFTTYYMDWLPSILDMYAEMNEALSQVQGQEMVDHIALDYGVAVTVYANGVHIFVNYGRYPFDCAITGVHIPAESWVSWRE